MRALELDFAQPARHIARGGVLLLVGAAVAALVAVSRYSELQGEAQALEVRLAKLERHARNQAPVATPVDASTQREVRRVNEIIDQIGLPWDRLFSALEEAAVARVVLLGIAPDAKTGVVQVNAETADSAAMFDYVKRLEQRPELANVYLLQHQREPSGGVRPLRFMVTASWMERQTR